MNTKNNLHTGNYLLYFISFFEGGCVMAAELLGAKLMAPFFGTSLHVWASVLASTLIALALGYFIGGILSKKANRLNTILLIALFGGIFIMLMPYSIKFALGLIGSLSITLSIIVSAVALLIPPLFMMGTISPLIIAELSEKNNNAGYVSGSIYAISTLGGILFTFLYGFYIIPTFGLKFPALYTGASFSLIPVIIFVLKRKYNYVAIWLAVIIASGYLSHKKHTVIGIEIKYQQEGMLGRVTVADYIPLDSNSIENGRVLMINNVVQGYENKGKGNSYLFEYHHIFIDIIEKNYPKGACVSALGLGTGTIPNILYKKNYCVEVCDIDERIHTVAKDYFNFDPNIKVCIDDARHYINNLERNFDVIVIDIFKGEESAPHLITLESFLEMKKHLNTDGVIMFNINGYIDGSIGKGNRSLLKTLNQAGFNFKVLPQGYNDTIPDQRNLFIIAATNTNKLDSIMKPYNNQLIPNSSIDLQNAVVFTDDIPQAEVLFAEASKRWREIYFTSSVILFGN